MCHQPTELKGITAGKNRGSLQVTLMKQPSFRVELAAIMLRVDPFYRRNRC